MVRVAIDGPVSSGKSTISRELAKRLGFIYIDTGALYRSVGLFCKEKNVNTDSGSEVAKAINEGLKLQMKLIDNDQHVFINGRDVSNEIRTPEISMLGSKISSIPAVREFLLDIQRDIAQNNSVIMDGRDIGTVILPDAEVKIFLTADPHIRAKRRYEELTAKGMDVTFEQVLSDLQTRDYNDTHRKIAPLRQADDAILADTSGLDFEQALELVMSIISRQLT